MSDINSTNSNRIYVNLSKITDKIGFLLKPMIQSRFWVKSQLSSMDDKGHIYGILAESNEHGDVVAQMRCVIWKSDINRIRSNFSKLGLEFKPQPGVEIGFQCSVQFHSQYGLSLKIHNADPAFTLGDLERKKRELLVKLKNENLLAINGQISVSHLPLRIGLITAVNSAAYADFLKTLQTSGFGFQVYTAFSTMQGDHMQSDVLSALKVLESLQLDLVVIIRGGGNKIDLSYFDNESIARRIANYRYPVWVGIGHEINEVVLDYLANRSFKTPTAVAEEIVGKFIHFQTYLIGSTKRILSTWENRYGFQCSLLSRKLNGLKQGTPKLIHKTRSDLRVAVSDLRVKTNERSKVVNVQILESRRLIKQKCKMRVITISEKINKASLSLMSVSYKLLSFKREDLMAFAHRMRLKRILNYIKPFNDELTNSLKRFSLVRYFALLDIKKELLNTKKAYLRAHDPKRVLKRGYSMTYKSDGTLLKKSTEISDGDFLITHLHQGTITSKVKGDK